MQEVEDKNLLLSKAANTIENLHVQHALKQAETRQLSLISEHENNASIDMHVHRATGHMEKVRCEEREGKGGGGG